MKFRILSALISTFVFQIVIINAQTISYSNPAYVNLAPCTCNINIGICDIGCCCDQDCSADDKNTFPLCSYQAPFSIDKLIDYWNCSNIENQKEDWFPVLCIHFSTTVLLGKFYKPINAIQTQADFVTQYRNSFISSYPMRSHYIEDQQQSSVERQNSLCMTKFDTFYSNSSCIKIKTAINRLGILTLPSPSFNKQCIRNTPVKYLMGKEKYYCETPIDINTCTSNPLLKHEVVDILSQPSISADIAIKNVEYITCSYDSYKDNSNEAFTPPASADNCGCKTSANTLIFDQYQTNACTSNSSSALPLTNTIPDKLNKDSYASESCLSVIVNTPSTPAVNPAGNGCDNVVTRIKYVFLWNNKTIKKVLVRVVYGSVLFSQFKKIKQLYDIKWYPYDTDLAAVNTMTQFETYLTNKQKDYLSGLKGYVIGKPVISGFPINNIVDTSTKYRIAGLLPNSDNLCSENALKQVVNFGVNTTTSCSVKIEVTDFSDCTCLRKLLLNRFNAYFAPSTYVSKNGNVATYDESNSQWIKVQRQNVDDIYLLANESRLKTCTNIPTAINVWFVYVEAGKARGEPIYEIITTYVNYTYSTWQYNCKSYSNNCPFKYFNIEFKANFIDLTKRDREELQGCNNTLTCFNDLFWLWTTDYGEDMLYLFNVNLSLTFGFFSLLIVYFMIYGLVCPF